MSYQCIISKQPLIIVLREKNSNELKRKSFDEILNTIEESKENENIPFCVF